MATYTNLKTDIELIKKDINYIKENIRNIDKCLNGNGKIGHEQRLEKLEAFQNKIIGALIVINVLWGGVAILIGYFV